MSYVEELQKLKSELMRLPFIYTRVFPDSEMLGLRFTPIEEAMNELLVEIDHSIHAIKNVHDFGKKRRRINHESK